MTRPYYDYEDRRPGGRFGSAITPGVRLIILANVIAFIVVALLDMVIGSATGGHIVSLVQIFGLSRAAVFQRFMIWQPLTYLFVHVRVWHLVINMLILWVCGCDVERIWGTRRFLFYYFLTGVGAGLCILFLGLLLGEEPEAFTIGASGAVLGALVAFGMLVPNRPITLLLLFVFPITVKAKHLAIGLGVVTFLFIIRDSTAGGVSHLAHLGGMVIGYLYVRFGDRFRSRFDDSVRTLRAPRFKMPRVRFVTKKEEHTREDIDAILDKIAAQGMDSLTDKEKEALRKASSSMR